MGNPSIRVFDGLATSDTRRMISSHEALENHHLQPISLAAKEHLGLLNGTAFSASVAALAMNTTVTLTILALISTAMCTEALIGSRGSYDPFIHNTARPHPGQVRVLVPLHIDASDP